MAVDASRRAALLVAYIHPVCALLAPCRAGASTPNVATLFPSEPLDAQTVSQDGTDVINQADWLVVGSSELLGEA